MPHRYYNIILDILFPPSCFGCKKYNQEYLCSDCWKKIEVNTAFYCPICQNRLPDGRLKCHPNASYALAPATDYRHEIVRTLIQDLKYNYLTSALAPIKKILDEYLKVCPLFHDRGIVDGIDFVLPVPIAKKRFFQRGFNQAELIAEHTAEKLHLPVLTDNLIKIKETPKQSEAKNWNERKENIAGCFALKNPKIIKGKNIILADDVFTSGATIGEAVKVLKRAGVRKIIALTLARAR